MDFSMIPFNSALDQLGELLPIGALIRLRTVVPVHNNVLRVNHRFKCITVELRSKALFSMTFEERDSTILPNTFTMDFASQEAARNYLPAECQELELHRTYGVIPETITCKSLWLYLATPNVLPFLKCGTREVLFIWKRINEPQCFLTLKEVMANLGANVKSLVMPWLASTDSAHIFHCEEPKTMEIRFRYFQMPFSTFEQLIEWLKKNAMALILRQFSECVYLCCPYHESENDAEEKIVQEAASPFCSHRPDFNVKQMQLTVSLNKKKYKFYYTLKILCHRCTIH